MNTAFSYIRWSSKAQSHGDSLRRQLQAAKTYAEEHNLILDTQHRDEGVSSYHGEHRLKGALSSFLSKVDSGEIGPGSYLLIDAFDRLGREGETNMIHLLTSLTTRGIKVVTLNDCKIYDEASDVRDLMWALMSISRAHEESVRKGQLVAAKRHQNKKLARELKKVWTSKGPFWADFDPASRAFYLNEERADTVRRIFTDYENGVGLTAMARILNAENVRGPLKAWTKDGIYDLLTSRRCLGEYQPTFVNGLKKIRTNDGPPIDGYYPAVIDPDQFNRVQGIIRSNARTKGRKSGPRAWNNIFIGISICGLCGGTVGAHSTTRSAGVSRPLVLRCVRSAQGACSNRTRYRYPEFESAFLRAVADFDFPATELASESKGASSKLRQWSCGGTTSANK